VTEIRSFINLVGYFRRIIAKFSEISEPLLKLTRKNVNFIWGKEQEISFQKLKDCLVKAPVLALPKNGSNYIIHCDASAVSAGAMLSRYTEQGERPVAFGTRLFNKTERNYSRAKKSCLLLFWFFAIFVNTFWVMK